MSNIVSSNWKIKKEFLGYIVHKDYYKFLKNELKKYKQHGNASIYKHSRDVAYVTFLSAKKHHLYTNEKFSMEDLVLSAFCHDFFMYDWHEKSHNHLLHGYTHAHLSAENAQKYCNLTNREKSIIESHMWPLNITKIPKTKEAWMLCWFDKLVTINEVFKR